jgi:imidazole glycerol-phosphate synthase subunit HisH
VIAIIDYHAGNLASVEKAFRCFERDCVVTSDPVMILRAGKIVLPGVGHFSVTAALANNGLRKTIQDCMRDGTPFLGICLGLQWLFDGSEEDDNLSGLGIFAGKCGHFRQNLKSPHVGWNQISLRTASPILRGIPDRSYFYFTHSYRAPVVDNTTALCHYGQPFTAAVERDNIFGVQFHPEKSGEAGLKLLENFCAL